MHQQPLWVRVCPKAETFMRLLMNPNELSPLLTVFVAMVTCQFVSPPLQWPQQGSGGAGDLAPLRQWQPPVPRDQLWDEPQLREAEAADAPRPFLGQRSPPAVAAQVRMKKDAGVFNSHKSDSSKQSRSNKIIIKLLFLQFFVFIVWLIMNMAPRRTHKCTRKVRRSHNTSINTHYYMVNYSPFTATCWILTWEPYKSASWCCICSGLCV